LKIAPAHPKAQVNFSRLKEGLLTFAQAARMLPEPWTEDRLRGLVKTGRLRAVVIEPDSSIKHSRGRQVKLWLALEDVLALDPGASPKTKKVRAAVAQKVVSDSDATRN
jgi:hypothetical protein